MMHAPLLQNWPAGQARPHEPQLSGSLAVFVHVSPHRVCPAMQGATHVPMTHVRSAAHGVPHPPQLALSLRTSVQTEPPIRRGGTQALATSAVLSGTQVLPTHAAVAAHGTPQPPQLAGSLAVLTQMPPQSVVGGAHETAHAPPLQTC